MNLHSYGKICEDYVHKIDEGTCRHQYIEAYKIFAYMQNICLHELLGLGWQHNWPTTFNYCATAGNFKGQINTSFRAQLAT